MAQLQSRIPIRGADDLVEVMPSRNTVVPLNYPIERGGEQITELVLRPMTGADIRQCGAPMKNFGTGSGGFDFDAPAVGRLLVALTGLPQATIDLLHPNDWLRAASEVAAFFRPPDRTS
jgi:hypothetical protein